MKKSWRYIGSVVLIFCLILGCYSGILWYNPKNENLIPSDTSVLEETITPQSIGTITQYNNKIIVHYLDVGQADCIFIELPNNETMLIDAGESKNKKFILNYIKELGYTDIDYVIATHPHADHIGSMNAILNEFEINNIFMPNKIHDTKMFQTMFNTIKDKDIPLEFVRTGYKILEQYNLIVEVLTPIQETYSNLNNYSVIIKIDFGESEFLFTGDAEILVEEELINNNIDIDSDILKVGHHGSNTSSSKTFITEVSPDIAVISCGINNKYNHPNIETLETLIEQKIDFYRTDELGTIIIEADKEENFTVITKNRR